MPIHDAQIVQTPVPLPPGRGNIKAIPLPPDIVKTGHEQSQAKDAEDKKIDGVCYNIPAPHCGP
jgi:hypothetical protein